MPNYWERVATFSITSKEDRCTLSPEQARELVENLEVMESKVFTPDSVLTTEILNMKPPGSDTSYGIVLISNRTNCCKCGSKLYVRADRMSKVAIYDDSLGTISSTHYTKYCRKRGCSLQQHYGYYTEGDASKVKYDEDWYALSYFMSTRETAFSMNMLHRLDTEILIGQISYKQRADIYNDIHRDSEAR